MLIAQTTTLTVPIIMQLGVAGIFVIMVLKGIAEILDKVRVRRNGNCNTVLPVDVLRQVTNNHEEQLLKNKQILELVGEFKVECARGSRAIENNNLLLERIIPILTGLE